MENNEKAVYEMIHNHIKSKGFLDESESISIPYLSWLQQSSNAWELSKVYIKTLNKKRLDDLVNNLIIEESPRICEFYIIRNGKINKLEKYTELPVNQTNDFLSVTASINMPFGDYKDLSLNDEKEFVEYAKEIIKKNFEERRTNREKFKNVLKTADIIAYYTSRIDGIIVYCENKEKMAQQLKKKIKIIPIYSK